jgi:glycosyltransferase involved in cell wall biosynthesis
MSRIDPKKGLDLLLPALEKLLQEGLNFKFILAGSNPQDPDYENKIRQKIQASSLASHTLITGFVSGDFKLELLQDADIFVLPSYYENFGIAVAEAMVAGIPVVISDQVHIWDAVQQADAGWITPCKIEDLTQVLREAIQNSAARKEKGNNARQLALKTYSWQAIAKQMIEVYQSLY